MARLEKKKSLLTVKKGLPIDGNLTDKTFSCTHSITASDFLFAPSSVAKGASSVRAAP